jgi:hypothetical protein
MTSHQRHNSSDASSSQRQTSPSSTRDPPTRTEDEDPMAVVYKAVIENPDFINKLADVLRANPGGLCGPRGATGAAGAVATEGGTHSRAEEIRFFFPDLHSSYGPSDIVTIGKDSFYRNASVFLDRVDDIVKLRGGDIVRTNLPSCLCGAALQWYTTELSDLEKQSLRSPLTTINPGDALHRWRTTLKKR